MKKSKDESAKVVEVTPARRKKVGPVRRILAVLGILNGLVSTYIRFVRPWHSRWGATDEEAKREMPGDDLIKKPWMNTTRAITINAPANKVWPWLAQLGQGRGGWYSYEWIENLMGLNIHNTDHILPEFQNLKVGDVIPTGAKGADIPVLMVEPERLLLLGGGDIATIAFALYPIDEQHTRLVARHRAIFSWKPLSLFLFMVMDPGVFIMFRKMLLTIKQRAEKLEQTQATVPLDRRATMPAQAEAETVVSVG